MLHNQTATNAPGCTIEAGAIPTPGDMKIFASDGRRSYGQFREADMEHHSDRENETMPVGMAELDLLEAICKGVDPRDGTLLDTPRNPTLDKARLAYLEALRISVHGHNTQPRASNKPPLHGRSWTPAEDQRLEALWCGRDTPTAEALAPAFGRSAGAILARLVHLKFFNDRETARAENQYRGSLSC